MFTYTRYKIKFMHRYVPTVRRMVGDKKEKHEIRIILSDDDATLTSEPVEYRWATYCSLLDLEKEEKFTEVTLHNPSDIYDKFEGKKRAFTKILQTLFPGLENKPKRTELWDKFFQSREEFKI